MNRILALKILNPILGILALNQIVTGFFHDALPEEAFEVLHEGGAILFAVAVLAHVVLNWGWIKANLLKRTPARGAGDAA